MTDEFNSPTQLPQARRRISGNSASNGIYGLGFIGAVVYYIQQATTLWAGLLGILKALIWPAMLVYQLLAFFKL